MSLSTPVTRIASWPPTKDHAYLRQFYGALRPHGITLVVDGLTVTDEFLRRNAQRFDAVHLHWPEHIWGHPRLPLMRRLHCVVGLWRFFRLLRSLGLRLIWTVHNLEHHEGSNFVDRIGWRICACWSDLIISHSEWCRSELVASYGLDPASIVVMPPGNDDSLLPRPNRREAVLVELGLSRQATTLLCFGAIRRYKGFDLAIEAARRLGKRFQLVIVGWAFDVSVVDELRARACDLDNVRLIVERVDDQRLVDLLEACDCVLLPYRRITTSAALLTALTCARPVVASDLPFFHEMIGPEPQAGVLCEPGSVDSLVGAIRQLVGSPVQSRRAAARRLADRYAWSSTIVPVAGRLRGGLAHTAAKESAPVHAKRSPLLR